MTTMGDMKDNQELYLSIFFPVFLVFSYVHVFYSFCFCILIVPSVLLPAL